MNRRCALVALVLLPATLRSAPAAELFTETFSADYNNWTTRVVSVTPRWTNQAVIFRIGFTMFPPIGSLGELIATNVSSSGAFVGDWNAAGIDQISFDFSAGSVFNGTHTNEFPSSLLLFLFNGSNLVSKPFATTRVHTTVTFSVLMDGLAAGGWGGDVTDEVAFAEFKTNITGFTLRTTVPSLPTLGSATWTNTFDNITLDRVQRAMRLQPSGTGDLVIVWDRLVTNRVYKFEWSPDLTSGAWTEISQVTATGFTAHTAAPSSETQTYFRLIR